MKKLTWLVLAGVPTMMGCNATDAPTTCSTATATYRADPVGSDVQFVLDRSGSMHLPIDDGETRWSATKSAVFTFLDRLQYRARGSVTLFPAGDAPVSCCPVTNPNCGECTTSNTPGPQNRCDAATYDSTALELLTPESIGALRDTISASDADHYWGTPLTAALAGASRVLKESESERKVMVLFTDGRPTACETPGHDDMTPNDIIYAIDAVAKAADSGVRTYVVGVVDGYPAAKAAHLSAIATAGNTARYVGCEDAEDCGFSVHIDTFGADVTSALTQIAVDAVSCTYALPPEAAYGEHADPIVQIQNGLEQADVPHDPSRQNGWDYDGRDDIRLYGAACETMKLEPHASVAVSVGCGTVE